VKADDERATSPGDVLRELFNEYGPCLLLVDEWVAYARQLHDQGDLPAGRFETHFTFAQALTESAKLAGNCCSSSVCRLDTTVTSCPEGTRRSRSVAELLAIDFAMPSGVEASWRPRS
jgi:hypothetical protein